MAIQAIETSYGGCQFRSRLEARWAVFFDHLRIRWQYELQGYKLRSGLYLPDFFLVDAGLFVEVKGDNNALAKDLPRMYDLVRETRKNLVVLGEMPPVAPDRWAQAHPCLRFREEVVQTVSALLVKSPEWGWTFLATDAQLAPVKVDTALMPGLLPGGEVLNAYTGARSARFEYEDRLTPRQRPASPDEENELQVLRLREDASADQD